MTQLTQSDIKYPTDVFHVKITFEETFSFAIETRETTVSGLTLSQMLSCMGKPVVDRFNKKSQIHETFRLKKIERA